MFQVQNTADVPVMSFTTEDFGVLENDEAASPTESAMRIRKQHEIPYTLYTVLMLDNSLSVGADLDEIRAASSSAHWTRISTLCALTAFRQHLWDSPQGARRDTGICVYSKAADQIGEELQITNDPVAPRSAGTVGTSSGPATLTRSRWSRQTPCPA